jgi:acyl carrier protein phosphodiesterase
MNYLAHIALAHPTDASRIGNFLGDFAKGTKESLLKNWPQDLVAGFMMHRSIDAFTDSHPTFSEAKKLISSDRRRLAGIAIDIFYDHFLSIHWDKFHSTEREDFIEDFYLLLERRAEWWIGDFSSAFPYLRKENWLGCYATRDGIELTLKRVSQRNRKWIYPLAKCMSDFTRHYAEFEKLFLALYPDLLAEAKRLKPSH